MAFIDDIKRTYHNSSMLMRIIFINIAIFVLLRIVAFGAMLFGVDVMGLLHWVDLSSDCSVILRRPWTVVTFMFSHVDFWPILFNMLWLYWIGRIFMEFFSPKQLMGLYLIGGWGGMVFFLLAYNFLPAFANVHSCLMGSSASVVAIVVATAIYVPDYKIGLLFLGQVSLKWIALAGIAFIVLSLDVQHPGGGIAHISAALVGVWYALRIKHGRDITRPLNAAIDFVVGLFNGRSWQLPKFSRRKQAASKSSEPRERAGKAATPTDAVSEEELDIILGKIKVAGYDALTDEEKDKLFKASRRRTV